MKKKIKFILVLIFSLSLQFSIKADDDLIDPEPYFGSPNSDQKFFRATDIIVVTANDYATTVGYQILENGGTVFDAAVSIQMILGLVEPQSSGIGGGTFVTFFDNKSKKTFSYEGRETAPYNIPNDLFLDENQKPKKFFSAAVGGLSVGVPATLKTFYELHKDFGKMEWKSLLEPAIKLSKIGFLPPNRLVSALKKDKFFLKNNPNSNFNGVLKDPHKKVVNFEYASTLEKVSKNIDYFYTGEIAKNIVEKVQKSENFGYLTLKDLKNYEIRKKNALCRKLKNDYLVCGPNLPSSGTICILQALKLYENLIQKKPNLKAQEKLDLKLSILDFVYFLRDKHLGDDEFENVNLKDLLDNNFLLNGFKNFKKKKISRSLFNIDKIFHSTSHFTLVDKYKNVLSATSSIESSFGSRIQVNGFILNNQLTDFRFKIKDSNNNKLKNIPKGNKRPLSSMTPLIIFDNKNDFFLTIGSPGGKAIISYIFRVLSDELYSNSNIEEIVEDPNFIRINGKTFFESSHLNKISTNKGKIRNLTSGIAIIKKKSGSLIGIADSRRDGTVRGR